MAIKVDPLFVGKPVKWRTWKRLWSGECYEIVSALSGSAIERGWHFSKEQAEDRCKAVAEAYQQQS